MRRQLGGAIAVLVAAACLAGGAAAQEAAGRFALAPDGDGFLRLDTRTGAVSYCRIVDGRWTCEAADTGGLADAVAAINERLGAIDAELATIREALATPPAADPAVAEALAALAMRIDAALAVPPATGLPEVMGDLRALAGRLDALAAAPAPVLPENALEPVLDAIGGLEARLDALAAAAGNEAPTAAMLEPLQAEIQTLAERVDALAAAQAAPVLFPETAFEPLRAGMAALSERVVELVAAQAAIAGAPVPAVMLPDPETVAALVEIGQRLAGLDEAVALLGAGPLDPALVAAVAALATELDAVAEAVAAIPPAPLPDPAVAARLAAIESRLEALAVPLAVLGQQAAAPSPALDGLRTDVAGLVDQVTALAGLPAAVEAVAGRIDAVAAQQVALAAAASPGIAPSDLAAVAQGLREELAVLATAVDRIGVIAVAATPDIMARLDTIDTTLDAIVPAADAAAAPLREAVDGIAADLLALREMAAATDVVAALAGLEDRIAAIGADVAALVPPPEAAGVAAGAELRGTGVQPEPTTFADELRRRLFDLGAALRRGLGG
jgi:hypothetical protein